MMDEDLEALLYDWHNEHLLVRQRADVRYWLDTLHGRPSVIVLGAGTGRVAVPLARRAARRVVALDRSLGRLARIPPTPGLSPLCADIRAMPVAATFDVAIMPYSTVQAIQGRRERQRALLETARVLPPGGSLYLDVSENFDKRPETDWHCVLRAPCVPLGDAVQEWQQHLRMDDHLLVRKLYKSAGRPIFQVDERWAYASTLSLDDDLTRGGFTDVRRERGYGAGASPHRLVYQALKARPRRSP